MRSFMAKPFFRGLRIHSIFTYGTFEYFLNRCVLEIANPYTDFVSTGNNEKHIFTPCSISLQGLIPIFPINIRWNWRALRVRVPDTHIKAFFPLSFQQKSLMPWIFDVEVNPTFMIQQIWMRDFFYVLMAFSYW